MSQEEGAGRPPTLTSDVNFQQAQEVTAYGYKNAFVNKALPRLVTKVFS